MEQQLIRPLQAPARKRKSDYDLQKSAKSKRKPRNDPERNMRWDCCNCFKIAGADDVVCTNCGISRCENCRNWSDDGCVDATSGRPATRGGLELEEGSQERGPFQPASGKSVAASDSETVTCHAQQPPLMNSREQTPTCGPTALQQTPDHASDNQRRDFHPSTPGIDIQEKLAGTASFRGHVEELTARLHLLALQGKPPLVSDGHCESQQESTATHTCT